MGGEEESMDAMAAAQARKERLRALKAAQELLNTPNEGSTQLETTNDKNDHDEARDADDISTNMKFRNYVPHDKKLQEAKLEPPRPSKFEDPVAIVAPPSEKTEDPFVNIAPKKPNWELRRDVQKKLDKLERRTQKAMCKLMEQEKKRQLEEEEEEEEEEGINAAED